MRKYRAQAFWNVKIEAVECERETESSVWIRNRRHNKCSEYFNYFGTFDEAKQFCISEAEKKVISARRELELANSLLGNAKGLKEAPHA